MKTIMISEELTENTKRLVRTSLMSFIVSFTIGTLLFLTYRYMHTTDESIILIIGFVFVIGAFFTNATILANNIISMALSKKYRWQLFFSSLLLLLNISISAYYFIHL